MSLSRLSDRPLPDAKKAAPWVNATLSLTVPAGQLQI